MGLRGPGAKPRSAKATKAAPKPRTSLPWQQRGLSRAERVIAFCEDLTISQGGLAGTKLKLRPWQKRFIRAVYAEDDAGRRPIRTAVLSMGRKNGKSLLASALGLCHLCGPEAEERGEVYSAANDREQAARHYAEMCAMLARHPELDARCTASRWSKEIEVLEGQGEGSRYKALSADASTKMGLNPSFIVYDELGTAVKRDLFDALDSAMGGRENPLLMVISTQAADDNAVLSELIDYGLRVSSGEVDDPHFHLTLYAAPDSADPWSPETWALANPALDDFRSLEDVERQAAQAQRVPSKENAFLNLILNRRVEAQARFIAKSEWEACGGEPEFARGRRCFGGLDLSGGRDLTALVLVFPDDAGGFDVMCRFFLPRVGIADKSEIDRTPWATWAGQGLITLNPGSTIDPAFVAEAVAELAAEYDIAAIAFDRWRIEDFKRELGRIGAEVPLVPFGQGFRDMGPAVDLLERLVAERKLRHGDHPVLKLCAGNAVVETDAAGNRKLTKARARGRIDGLVALGMAASAAGSVEPPKPKPSFQMMVFNSR